MMVLLIEKKKPPKKQKKKKNTPSYTISARLRSDWTAKVLLCLQE
jgi:hypothetical protein